MRATCVFRAAQAYFPLPIVAHPTPPPPKLTLPTPPLSALHPAPQVSQAEALVEERDEEIRKVVETIAELAQIMRDLSTLVVEQGTMLDRIDHNITETAMKVEEGVKELVKAEKTQKQGRAMLCIMALLVMIGVLLIVVIVRHA